MSDENADAAETAADATQEQPENPPEPKPTETVEFWKSKAREQEKRAKDNALAAAELAAFKDAQKTQEQRDTERLAAETARADAAEQTLMRHTVAESIDGFPAKAIKFLTGSTLEEVAASAKDVMALIGDAGKPRTPKPDPNQGHMGAEVSTPASQFGAFLRQQLDNA